jgi:serine/threonine protein phosphatase PrpC
LEKELRARKATFAANPTTTLTTVFAHINDGLCSDPKIDAYMSGSTAALVFLFPRRRKVVVAHLGDSRVIFGRKTPEGEWKAEQVTKYVSWV